eukprot:1519251-Prymnesium_polylepis.1
MIYASNGTIGPSTTRSCPWLFRRRWRDVDEVPTDQGCGSEFFVLVEGGVHPLSPAGSNPAK